MAPVTDRRRRRPDPGRGAGRHDVRAARAPRRAGDLRVVRVVDVDADRRARRSARPSRRSCSTWWPSSPGASACRSAPAVGSCASKVADAQAAYESANTLQADDARRRQLRAARGRLAGGRAVDRLREVRPRRRPARAWCTRSSRASTCRANGQAVDAISENEPGSTSSARAHTLANFEPRSTAAPRPTTPATSSGWRRASLDAAQRANTIWKKTLAEYEPPPLDDAIDEELQEFITRRKTEMPDEHRLDRRTPAQPSPAHDAGLSAS